MPRARRRHACAEVVAKPPHAARVRSELGPERREAAGAAEPRAVTGSVLRSFEAPAAIPSEWGGGTQPCLFLGEALSPPGRGHVELVVFCTAAFRTLHPAASGSPHPVPALKVTFPPTQPQLPALNRDPGLFWGGAGWGPQVQEPQGTWVIVCLCVQRKSPFLLGPPGRSQAHCSLLGLSLGLQVGRREVCLSNLMSVKLDLPL